MSFDYSKLDGRITEKFGTRYRFADAMGISEHTISKRMNGKLQWKDQEIHKACVVLDIPFEEIPIYFFVVNVQSVEHEQVS